MNLRFSLSLVLVAVILLGSAGLPRAQSFGDFNFFSEESASLREILDRKSSVASVSETSFRESPGVLTIITREEIESSGARNFIDVLRLVPGFEIAMDVQGNLGLGVRGNWGNEGKVLLTVDGQSYNELLYSTLQFDRFSVEQIQQVEIIRGPGSVIYGGFAELAVINITTRGVRNFKGSRAAAVYGQMRKDTERASLNYSFAGNYGGTEVSALAYASDGSRSDRRYTDFSGSSYSMAGNSDLRDRNLNLAVSRSGLSLRFIYDDYHTSERDQFDDLLSTGPTAIDFPLYLAEVKYEARLSGALKIVPRLNLEYARPWREMDENFPYDKSTRRIKSGVTVLYTPRGSLSFVGGGEYYEDAAKIFPVTDPQSAYLDGRTKAEYSNRSVFLQGSLASPAVNVTAGARYENNSEYGESFVPRLALTKVIDGLHFKAIYSGAFKAPSIENIRLNPGIKPERTITSEIETGYQFNEEMYLSANIFDIVIRDPIVFFSSSPATEHYENYPRTGTRGFELVYKFKRGAESAELSYSYYAAYRNNVDIYAVPSRDCALLGLPAHKLTFRSSFKVSGFYLNPSGVYTVKRYGYSPTGEVKDYGGSSVINFYVYHSDVLIKNLTLGIGVYDVFNSGFSYPQPYHNIVKYHAPLPAQSREFLFKASYEF